MKTTNSNTTNGTQPEVKKSIGNRFLHFLLRHIIIVLLIFISIGLYVWAKIEMNKLSTDMEQQKIEMTNFYENKIDSLTVHQMELTAKTFSWAVRSELQRENKEQVSQFFNDLIKQNNITKLQYINADNSTIEISTNKKEEGAMTDSELSKVNSQLTKEESSSFIIATPIMGLNKKLGTVIVSVSK